MGSNAACLCGHAKYWHIMSNSSCACCWPACEGYRAPTDEQFDAMRLQDRSLHEWLAVSPNGGITLCIKCGAKQPALGEIGSGYCKNVVS